MEDNGTTQDQPARKKRARGPKTTTRDFIVGDTFECQSISDFWQFLKAQVDEAENSFIPELRRTTFSLRASAVLQLSNITDEELPELGYHSSIISAATALEDVGDATLKAKRQAAVAWTLVRAAEAIDGYKYFKKQGWQTKQEDGFRFNFLCIDSFQNKDRAQNKARKSGSLPAETTANSSSKEPSLPTYDCNGCIIIKFSSIDQAIAVHYQHLPIHRDTAVANGVTGAKKPNVKPVSRQRDESTKAKTSSKSPIKQKIAPKPSPNVIDQATTFESSWTGFSAKDADLINQQLVNEALAFNFDDPFGNLGTTTPIPTNMTKRAREREVEEQKSPARPTKKSKVPLPKTHASVACEPCRKRKKKCDRTFPTCVCCVKARAYGPESCVYADSYS